MRGIRKMGKEYKDFKLEDIPKLKMGAIIVGIVLAIIAVVWSTITMGKNTSIELELKVGETIDIGSVKVELDDEGKVKGSNEHVSCSVNQDPVNEDMKLIKITGISKGKATIKVTSVTEGEYTTYKYKIKVID